MTVKKLKDLISLLPDNMQVWVRSVESDFPIAPAERGKVASVNFKEDPDDKKALARDSVFLITEQ